MKRVILVLGPSRCNIGMLGCYRVLEGVTGSHWAVTEAEEVLRVEESGEGREWRWGSGGQACHHLLPGRRRGDGGRLPLSTVGALHRPPTDRGSTQQSAPAQHPKPQTGSNFKLLISNFEPRTLPYLHSSFLEKKLPHCLQKVAKPKLINLGKKNP